MVSAIGANTGIITCGIFGSVMWWPEAELRSHAEAVGMRLPSEDRVRPNTNQESPRSSMSKVLRRYFTPSSAALAQATLERMRSSGDLQGSMKGADTCLTQTEDSVDLDDGAHAHVQLPAADAEAPPTAASEQGTAASKLCCLCCKVWRLVGVGIVAFCFTLCVLLQVARSSVACQPSDELLSLAVFLCTQGNAFKKLQNTVKS